MPPPLNDRRSEREMGYLRGGVKYFSISFFVERNNNNVNKTKQNKADARVMCHVLGNDVAGREVVEAEMKGPIFCNFVGVKRRVSRAREPQRGLLRRLNLRRGEFRGRRGGGGGGGRRDGGWSSIGRKR